LKSNPSLLSNLGCGGALLFGLGLPCFLILLWSLLTGSDPRGVELRVGDESFALRQPLLLIPLSFLSVVAVFRLAFGHRDWLAPMLAAIWLGIAATLTIETHQFTFLALTAVTAYLLASGIWRDRRLAEKEREGPES
jgi:hypothetical protein